MSLVDFEPYPPESPSSVWETPPPSPNPLKRKYLDEDLPEPPSKQKHIEHNDFMDIDVTQLIHGDEEMGNGNPPASVGVNHLLQPL
jgi:hypothetical protein